MGFLKAVFLAHFTENDDTYDQMLITCNFMYLHQRRSIIVGFCALYEQMGQHFFQFHTQFEISTEPTPLDQNTKEHEEKTLV